MGQFVFVIRKRIKLPADQASVYRRACAYAGWFALHDADECICSVLLCCVLPPPFSIFIFVNNTLPPAAALMSQVYKEFADPDG